MAATSRLVLLADSFGGAIVLSKQCEATGVAEHAPGAAGLRVRVTPNPSRGEAMIKLEGFSGRTVRLGVFDAAGRKVRDLGPVVLASGSSAIGWDGRDGSGAAAPSGVYWVHAEAGRSSVSTQLTLSR